jgi:hypothetical protein
MQVSQAAEAMNGFEGVLEATYIPSDSKSKCFINISGAELRDCTW